jgi:hypothetical protein
VVTELKEGVLYRVRCDLGEGSRVRTCIRRRFPDGRPSVYYIEDDYEEEYVGGLAVSRAEVRRVEIRHGKAATVSLGAARYGR